MSTRTMLLVIGLVLLAGVIWGSVFTVKSTERALILQFGAVTSSDLPAGLHVKIPIAQQVLKFDARVLTLDSRPERYFTSEKKPLIVDSFAKFRIADVEKYYTANSGDENRVRNRLQERINEGLRNQISRRSVHEVISGERDQLMEELRDDLNEVMQRDLGVAVIDVRVKRIDLPREVSVSVYDRMNSEREIEAQQHRAAGKEQALAIQADADRQVVVIEAEAYREAEQVRGDGDATSAAIYARAFEEDPEFYAFYRSLDAYRNTFKGREDILLLDPDSEFFRYLERSGGN